MLRTRPAHAGRLAVGVPTFRRPQALRTLLDALGPHLDEVTALLDAPAEVVVIVVDNDPEGSAREVATGHPDSRIRYSVEPRPGVSAARNAVLDRCDEIDADLLLFIDDDETPEPGWASGLVQAWQTWDVAGVTGPVVSRTEVPMDPWVTLGGFYTREHRSGLPAGAPVRRAATNNLLLDLSVVRQLGLRFDGRFGFSGGEDSVFTGTLVDLGHSIAWCPTATVVDHLPADRATRSYVLNLHYSMAKGTVRSELALAPSVPVRLRIWSWALVTGVARLGLGTVRGAWGRARGSVRHQARGARAVAVGRGKLTAFTGGVSEPYRYGRSDSPQDAEDR